MRVLPLLLLFCISCAIVKPQICEQPTAKPQIFNKGTIEQNAWQDIRNNELIGQLEREEYFNAWRIYKDVILAQYYDLNLSYNHMYEIFDRASIFYDGTLYLDGYEKLISVAHKNRLKNLFNKIVESRKK